MREQIHTLIVDDEEGIRFFLSETLRRLGHTVTVAASGEEALEHLRETRFDLAIVDLKLGGRVDGLRLLETIKWRWVDTAVIILTAYATMESALAAIREGVDGYLLKPVQPAELRQVIQEVLSRRLRSAPSADERAEHIIRRGIWLVDQEKYVALRDGKELNLTPQEFALLAHLLRNAGRVLPPDELVHVVRGYKCQDTWEAREIVKWYIHRMRRKIEPNPARPQHILNVRGVGYRFQE
ncbi:MAG: response regulator transcription factor [Anaerolineae bacterium]|nr:response regulator transcription factor [Anaerolineae bacterium]